MRAEGFDVTTPDVLREQLSAQFAALSPEDAGGLARLQSEERATAADDFGCQQREMDQVTNKLMSDQRQVLVDSGSTLFDDLGALTQAQQKTSQGAITLNR